ncbi:MAG: chromosome partitioning protein ParB [Bacteroidetes bacterium RIFCSPLOWO2_02_FULL_36_8]|nr:MAG: chromosome partitioning protein ParB [Bacteroidetes bacterium RIFCSPLOWO2_02_FULL_36_8]OFY71626.1 MAG: chromosome partitioning protein ParB [Bacteroidetes bacterium RIFCSPLOWO2_12_FULL_37_12]
MEKKEEKKPKRTGLGRGLSALLSDNMENSLSQTTVSTDFMARQDPSATIGSTSSLPVEQVEVNPFQPRTYFNEESLKGLSESIKTHGLIQPITVRKLGYEKYQIISGERRLRASKIAGLTHIPAYIRVANDQGMLELALVENLHRDDLNPIETSLGYKRLLDECKITIEEVGNRVGLERSTVNNYLRLLKLPPEIQIGLRDNQIQMGHARALITLENIDTQLWAYNECIKKDLSVRKVEKLVQEIQNANGDKPKKTKLPDGALSFEMRRIQSQLSSHFGTKVEMQVEPNGKGNISIPFYSEDDLNRLMELINP